MKPSDALAQKHHEISAILRDYRVVNPRVFGSICRGSDTETSDLDLLIDAPPGTTLFDLGGLQDALEALLGFTVDVRTPKDLPERIRKQVLAEARPL